MSKEIRLLPTKSRSKKIDPLQGVLDLRVDRETEIQGIGMGVLSDGTPFLTQRGLAHLCGVRNAHIGGISVEWNEIPQKPRIIRIRDSLSSRGVTSEVPYIQVKDGARTIYAYPDSICLAILEYYAFDAGSNCRDEARNNFRMLAGKALQDFIYTQVGYSPNTTIPASWQQFHDRVTLAYHTIPHGYFSIFKEIADLRPLSDQSGAKGRSPRWGLCGPLTTSRHSCVATNRENEGTPKTPRGSAGSRSRLGHGRRCRRGRQ